MASNKTPTKTKKKMKPRGGNSPVIGMNGYMLEPGDNRKFLLHNVKIMNFPDIDLNDVDQVNKRLDDFFQTCAEDDVKPSISAMAMALNGHSRQWLWALVNDRPQGGAGNTVNLSADSTNSIKKAHKIMSSLWEDYMQNGKINPVAGIFLGKNNFGMEDKVEHVVTPNTNPDSDYDSEDIKSRYLTDSQIVNEPTDSTDSE